MDRRAAIAGWAAIAAHLVALVACGPSAPGTDGSTDADLGDEDLPAGCFAQIEAGTSGTFALKTDGTLWTWGGNGVGQRGLGTITPAEPTPVRVDALGTEVVHVGAGRGGHACAVTADGSVWCWGSNDYGQLGDGSKLERSSPFRVVGLDGAAEVSVGDRHTCARKGDGTLWCWGEGRSVDGRFEDHLQPAQIVTLGDAVVQASVGSAHTCAVKADGSLWCWGRLNREGELGDGTTEPRAQPVQVTALGSEVVQVSAGSATTCAVKRDGTLWCWGENEDGQVGDGTTVSPRTSPVRVAALGSDVARVSTVFRVVCARKRDGSAWCWGRNEAGAIGIGTIDHSCELVGPCSASAVTPVRVEALGTQVVSVSVGGHVCALKRDATVWCWGANSKGAIGDGTTDGEPFSIGEYHGVARPSPVRAAIDCG